MIALASCRISFRVSLSQPVLLSGCGHPAHALLGSYTWAAQHEADSPFGGQTGLQLPSLSNITAIMLFVIWAFP